MEMVKKGVLEPHREEVFELRKQGVSYQKIASKFGVSYHTVFRLCNDTTTRYTVSNLGLPDKRKVLTDKEKEEILSLRARGIPYANIAKRYGICYATVYLLCNPDFVKRTEEKLKARGGRHKLYYNRQQNTDTKRRHFQYISEAVKRLKHK
jgi:DNA invertase Pin-like site-specific DNA recombinase